MMREISSMISLYTGYDRVYMIELSVLSVRMDSVLEKKLQYLMEKRQINDKSAFVRQLLTRSLTAELIEYLCSEVKKKQMSAWKAAEIAEIPLSTILSELSKRDISLVDEQSLREDIAFASEDVT